MNLATSAWDFLPMPSAFGAQVNSAFWHVSGVGFKV